MRRKLARALRKVADLIDPYIKPSPSGVMVIRVECDASQFEEEFGELKRKVLRLADAMKNI